MKARNVYLTGMPGSGKSTIGAILAKRLGMEFADTDVMIEAESGKSIPEVFEQCGEAGFRALESAALRVIAAKKNTVVATGGGIILDGDNIRVMRETGVIAFVDRPLELILGDIDHSSRPLAKDKEQVARLYRERIGLYRQRCDFSVLNSGSAEEAANAIIEALRLR